MSQWTNVVGSGAPKWTHVLVLVRGERRIAYKSDTGLWYSAETELIVHPTHWMPLPDAPVKESASYD